MKLVLELVFWQLNSIHEFHKIVHTLFVPLDKSIPVQEKEIVTII